MWHTHLSYTAQNNITIFMWFHLLNSPNRNSHFSFFLFFIKIIIEYVSKWTWHSDCFPPFWKTQTFLFFYLLLKYLWYFYWMERNIWETGISINHFCLDFQFCFCLCGCRSYTSWYVVDDDIIPKYMITGCNWNLPKITSISSIKWIGISTKQISNFIVSGK